MGEDPPRPGTDGYPPGTDGYPVGLPTPAAGSSSSPNETGGDQPDDDNGEGEGDERSSYWTGFESPEAFFDHIEAERAKIQGYWETPRRRRHIPTPGFPTGTEIAGSETPARRQVGVRQVGVKLRAVDFELLAQAAELCGVAPSTLARMLVRRGAKAIVDSAGSGGGGSGGEPG